MPMCQPINTTKKTTKEKFGNEYQFQFRNQNFEILLTIIYGSNIIVGTVHSLYYNLKIISVKKI